MKNKEGKKPEVQPNVEKTTPAMNDIFGTKPEASQLEKMVDSWGQPRKPKTKK
jgi:hypothetical protein